MELHLRVSGCRALEVKEFVCWPTIKQGQGHVVLPLVSSHWWVKLVPQPVLAHCWADPHPGVSGCRSLGVLKVLLTHWYVGLDPGPFGGQSCHREAVGSGSLRKLACWWVKLWPHPPSCLAWPEESQFWCLHTGVWGWVPILITYREDSEMVLVSTSIFMIENAPCH